MDEHQKILFVHSACCNAHWEVILKEDGTGMIQCEKCGKLVSQGVIQINHKVIVDKCSCDVCKKDVALTS